MGWQSNVPAVRHVLSNGEGQEARLEFRGDFVGTHEGEKVTRSLAHLAVRSSELILNGSGWRDAWARLEGWTGGLPTPSVL